MKKSDHFAAENDDRVLFLSKRFSKKAVRTAGGSACIDARRVLRVEVDGIWIGAWID